METRVGSEEAGGARAGCGWRLVDLPEEGIGTSGEGNQKKDAAMAS